jgi:hypothetical protein
MNLDIKKKNLNFIYTSIKISKDICNIICNYIENNIIRIIYTEPVNKNLNLKITIKYHTTSRNSLPLSIRMISNNKYNIYIKREQEACIKYFNYIYRIHKKGTLLLLDYLENDLIQELEDFSFKNFTFGFPNKKIRDCIEYYTSKFDEKLYFKLIL